MLKICYMTHLDLQGLFSQGTVSTENSEPKYEAAEVKAVAETSVVQISKPYLFL